jgi:hypothetical protein
MLHVNGTSIIGGAMTASSTLNISGAVTMNTTANISGNTSIMGTLGVGIASPLNKLDVRGTGPTAISIGDLSAIRGTIGYVDSNGNYSTNGVVGDMVFRTEDNTKKLHLQAGTGSAVVTVSNTSMGIGNINPSANLHVSGTSIISGAMTTSSTLNVSGAMIAASTVNTIGAMTATSTLNVSGTTTLSNKVVLGPNSTTPSNNATITTSKSVHFVNPASDITGTILEAGTNDGQMFVLVNRSAYDIYFDATDATADVAMSSNTIVYAKSSVMFIWSATDSLWYPARDTF